MGEMSAASSIKYQRPKDRSSGSSSSSSSSSTFSSFRSSSVCTSSDNSCAEERYDFTHNVTYTMDSTNSGVELTLLANDEDRDDSLDDALKARGSEDSPTRATSSFYEMDGDSWCEDNHDFSNDENATAEHCNTSHKRRNIDQLLQAIDNHATILGIDRIQLLSQIVTMIQSEREQTEIVSSKQGGNKKNFGRKKKDTLLLSWNSSDDSQSNASSQRDSFETMTCQGMMQEIYHYFQSLAAKNNLLSSCSSDQATFHLSKFLFTSLPSTNAKRKILNRTHATNSTVKTPPAHPSSYGMISRSSSTTSKSASTGHHENDMNRNNDAKKKVFFDTLAKSQVEYSMLDHFTPSCQNDTSIITDDEEKQRNSATIPTSTNNIGTATKSTPLNSLNQKNENSIIPNISTPKFFLENSTKNQDDDINCESTQGYSCSTNSSTISISLSVHSRDNVESDIKNRVGCKPKEETQMQMDFSFFGTLDNLSQKNESALMEHCERDEISKPFNCDDNNSTVFPMDEIFVDQKSRSFRDPNLYNSYHHHVNGDGKRNSLFTRLRFKGLKS